MNYMNTFMRNKNSRIPPGWSFGFNDQFEDRTGHVLPMRSVSIAMSKVNDEPARVHVETAHSTPQGIIRKKRNFEIGRKSRMKRRGTKCEHEPKRVSFDLGANEEEDEYSDPIVEGEYEEDVDDAVDELKTEIMDEFKDSIENSLDKNSEPDVDEAEEAVDVLTKKLKRAGFSSEKIKLVKKMIFDVLE